VEYIKNSCINLKNILSIALNHNSRSIFVLQTTYKRATEFQDASALRRCGRSCESLFLGTGMQKVYVVPSRSRRATRSIKAIGPIYIFSFTWPVPRNVSRQDRVPLSGFCLWRDEKPSVCGSWQTTRCDPADWPRWRQEPSSSSRYFGAASRSWNTGIRFARPSVRPSR